MPLETPTLKMMGRRDYPAPQGTDPLRWYYWPVLGTMYRGRVEQCLRECTGGSRVLDVGFGSGVTFFNLHELYLELHGIDLDTDAAEVETTFRRHGVATHLQNANVLDIPYGDNFFDTVLLVSILEHLRPDELQVAFRELRRVLRPGGQVVYGVPVERKLMTLAFRLMGSDIRTVHFSTHDDVARAARAHLSEVRVNVMNGYPSFFGPVYEVGHFVKD